MKVIPNHAEHKELLASAYRRLEKRIGQSEIVSATSIAQTILSGYKSTKNPKNISDESIRKFDDLYPGWRNINEADENLIKPPVVIGGIKVKSMEDNLLIHYSKLSEESRDVVDMVLNKLYSLEYPKDFQANPNNNKNGKNKVKP